MHLQPPRMEKLNMELEARGFTVYMAARAGQHRIQEPYFYLKIKKYQERKRNLWHFLLLRSQSYRHWW